MAGKHSKDKISIILPVLNEEKVLRNTLKNLHVTDSEELIVVDGGSSDDSFSIASEFTHKVYTAKTGRARVMNYGAERAGGDILLFLHADCLLPENAFLTIRETLSDMRVVAGAFHLRIEHPALRFRVIELGVKIRTCITSLIYGDQGMFIRKATFKGIGGFNDIPLMEDVEISGRIKKAGKIVIVKAPIKVSPRRWLEEGALYTTLRDWMNVLSFTLLRISPERLIKYYRDIR